jgi:hypothetical protein
MDTTSASLRDTLLHHRQASNRIIREFLIGDMNVRRILHGTKPIEYVPSHSHSHPLLIARLCVRAQQQDTMLLYQHAARCPYALQLFLNAHPTFWCLVPMPLSTLSFSTLTPTDDINHEEDDDDNVRTRTMTQYFVDGIPPAPPGYAFSDYQRTHEQFAFFRHRQDQLQSLTRSQTTDVDLFQATIVAVLPLPCSPLLAQVLLSLFVTHADCRLNASKHLIHVNRHRDYPFRGLWCADLVRPPSE